MSCGSRMLNLSGRRTVKEWPTQQKPLTFSPTPALAFPWLWWLNLSWGKDPQPSTQWISKVSLPPATNPSVHSTDCHRHSHKATPRQRECNSNCPSSKLLETLHMPVSENHAKTVWYVTTNYRDHSSSPQISTPLRKVRVQEAAPFAVHRGGLYRTTICMMREWGDQMLYVSLYLCCNKSGTLGSPFWLDRENMTALGYKKNSDQEVI